MDKDKGGYETLDELVEQCGGEDLFDTVIAQTGGGGQHYFFSARDANSFRSVTSWRQGIDIKAAGGGVVVAPSRHESGGKYVWCEGCDPWEKDLLPLPALLRDILPRRDARTTQEQAAKSERRRRGVIPDGRRNDTLFRIASALRGQGLEEDDIYERLLEENVRCGPMLDEAEVERIAHSTSGFEPDRRAATRPRVSPIRLLD